MHWKGHECPNPKFSPLSTVISYYLKLMALSHMIPWRRPPYLLVYLTENKVLYITEKLTMPKTCIPESKLAALAFRSQDIKNLLLDLYAYGGAGTDGIIPLILKVVDILSPKIAFIYANMQRQVTWVLAGRVGNVYPFSKCGSGSSCPSHYRPITITPVLSKVFERLLIKHLNAFARKNNLFPSLQLGFWKGLGTCDVLLTIKWPSPCSLEGIRFWLWSSNAWSWF